MSANFSFATAKVQQNLRICKFCVEKVLGVLKVLKVLKVIGGELGQARRDTVERD